MIEALKSLLQKAGQARQSGEAKEAERLYKEAAAQAAADEATERAEALTGIAQARRDSGDRISAVIYYAEAITLFRNASANVPLAKALRHAADIRSEMGEFGVAGTQIEEAVRLYRAALQQEEGDATPLDLANALRVAALNDERQAVAAWREAAKLYTQASVDAGAQESERRVRRLSLAITESEENA